MNKSRRNSWSTTQTCFCHPLLYGECSSVEACAGFNGTKTWNGSSARLATQGVASVQCTRAIPDQQEPALEVLMN